MAFSDFSLRIDEHADLFADVEPVPPNAAFATALAETSQLAIAINTDKARSEMIITPVLLELWRLTQAQISLFSGTEFKRFPEIALMHAKTMASKLCTGR